MNNEDNEGEHISEEGEKSSFYQFNMILSNPSNGSKISAKNFCVVEIVPEDYTPTELKEQVVNLRNALMNQKK